MKKGLRDVLIIYSILLFIPVLVIVALAQVVLYLHLDLTAWPFTALGLVCFLFWLGFAFNLADKKIVDPRPKPDGYVGRFRRLDGKIVHVARLKDGTLMVASEERTGVMPKDLGTVTGPELLKWDKLASTPDGH